MRNKSVELCTQLVEKGKKRDFLGTKMTIPSTEALWGRLDDANELLQDAIKDRDYKAAMRWNDYLTDRLNEIRAIKT